MERESFGSRLGFILLSAGCAIGIGNVWKFPYLVGQNGGGAFVLIYLFFLVIMGVPVMTMEFAMGRGSKKSPVKMYQQLEKPGSKWHIHGLICMIANVILMMFYTTVAGWMLQYFFKTATGQFAGKDADAVAAVFGDMLMQPGKMVIAMGITVVAGFFVCSIGLQKGLEKVTKVMMICLLVIMVVLAFNSIFLKGAAEGLVFYLKPDLNRMKDAGLGNVVVAAMNQSFFTLSLGIGSMAIFGSYIDREHSLMGEAVNVALLDTFVAITSGLIIMPACFAFGVEPGAGPGLIFITLPNIFNNMPLGRLWGSLFFIFMSFAAFSTVLAVFENIMACLMDLTGWDRKKTGLICAIGMFILSLPCLLGFNVLSNIQPMGPDTGIMDLEDFIVSNLLLPGGSLLFVLFCTLRYGWGWDKFTAEADAGEGLKVAGWMRPYMTFVLPVIILVILVIGLI
ncbi:MAG: sodium-dependent transporter [Lachnospiraceae bacterium]|nr:sodium-dependent transporter [Lachnospiraceae bacterium]